MLNSAGRFALRLVMLLEFGCGSNANPWWIVRESPRGYWAIGGSYHTQTLCEAQLQRWRRDERNMGIDLKCISSAEDPSWWRNRLGGHAHGGAVEEER